MLFIYGFYSHTFFGEFTVDGSHQVPNQLPNVVFRLPECAQSVSGAILTRICAAVWPNIFKIDNNTTSATAQISLLFG